MTTSLPAIDFLNNSTQRNRERIEREANLNLNSNSALPTFSLPTSNFSTKYPNGIYDINTNVTIRKRRRGRPSTRKVIQSTRKRNKSLNNETVISFINEMLQGTEIPSLSIKYGVSQSTGYKLRADYKARQDYPFRASRGGGKRRKITSEDSEFFNELINNNPQITLTEMKEKLKQHTGKDVSISTIDKHLRNKMKEFGLPNYSVKRCVYIENRRNSEEILEKRIKYINIYRECLRQGRDFVFIDETPFNTTCFNNTGRSPVGTPCRMLRPFTKYRNITAITAINRTFGVISTTFVEGPVNQYVFMQFLNKLFQIMERFRIRPIYVMDNVTFHKTKKIQELFEITGNNCLLTAPWSCELNPIEYIFGIWKRRIKVPRNVQPPEIKDIIQDGLLSITKEEVGKTIYFVETVLFHFALERKNLALHSNQRYFHNEYLKVGGDESKILNYDSDSIMEDSNEEKTIDDCEENLLCTLPGDPCLLGLGQAGGVAEVSDHCNDTTVDLNSKDSNSFLEDSGLLGPEQAGGIAEVSDHCNDTTVDLNSKDSNSFLDSPLLNVDSLESDQNASINDDNELALLVNHRPGKRQRDTDESFHPSNESTSQISDIILSKNEANSNAINESNENIEPTLENFSKAWGIYCKNQENNDSINESNDKTFANFLKLWYAFSSVFKPGKNQKIYNSTNESNVNNDRSFDNLIKTGSNSSSLIKQGNDITNPHSNERSSHIPNRNLLTCNDIEYSIRNTRCSNFSPLNLNDDIEQSTQNNEKLTDSQNSNRYTFENLRKLVSNNHYPMEISSSISNNHYPMGTSSSISNNHYPNNHYPMGTSSSISNNHYPNNYYPMATSSSISSEDSSKRSDNALPNQYNMSLREMLHAYFNSNR